MLDNSVKMQLAAEIESGIIINLDNPLPFGVEQYLGQHFNPKKSEQTSIENIDTIEDVRRKDLESVKKRNNSGVSDDSSLNA